MKIGVLNISAMSFNFYPTTMCIFLIITLNGNHYIRPCGIFWKWLLEMSKSLFIVILKIHEINNILIKILNILFRYIWMLFQNYANKSRISRWHKTFCFCVWNRRRHHSYLGYSSIALWLWRREASGTRGKWSPWKVSGRILHRE